MTDYLEQGKQIWRSFVPPSGQAVTVQGELLRVVEKMRDEAMRNGNGNWDEGFAILLAYLRRHLLDPAVFSPDECGPIAVVLERLEDHDDPLLDDESYDELGDRVCDWYARRGLQPHVHNPQLRR